MSKKLIAIFSIIISMIFVYIMFFFNYKVDDYFLNYSYINMNINEQKSLIVSNMNSDINQNEVDWVSSDNSIVSIDTDGVITSNNFGSAIISAKYKNKTFFCNVYVSEILIKSLDISYLNNKISVGEEMNVLTTILPNDAYNKTLSFKSSNISVATITNNGTIEGISPGKTTISVSTTYMTSNIVKTFELTVVNEVTAEKLSLNETNIELPLNSSKDLSYKLSPENIVNKTITWESTNSSIVEVDSNGTIVAKSTGSATITAKTSNGLVSSCKVTVPVVPLQSISVKNSIFESRLKIGSSIQINTNINPTNTTTNFHLKYECDITKSYTFIDSKLVVYSISVSNTGVVSAKKLNTTDTDGLYPLSHRITITAVDENNKPISYNGKVISTYVDIFVVSYN